MKTFKNLRFWFVIFLALGINLSKGLPFKKKGVVEELSDSDEIKRMVKQAKEHKRVPADESSSVAASNNSKISTDNIRKNNNRTEFPDSGDSDENETLPAYATVKDESLSRFNTNYKNTNRSAHTAKKTETPSTSLSQSSYSGVPSIGSRGGDFIEPHADNNDSNNSREVSFSISSIAIKNGELILKGKNLSNIKNINVNGNSVSQKLVKVSSSTSKLVALGISGIQLAAGKVYNLVISDAHASNTFPIEIELADGSVSSRKLAPLGAAEDGFVLKWDAIGHTWVAAPDEVGAGPDGGITSITKGVGIVGEGTVIETSATIAVDVGINANQIPRFDADKKLVLNNTNVIELDQTSTINFKENAEEFVFGMFSEIFKLRNKTNDTTIFEVVGNDFYISGRSVCLSDGTNCPTTGGDYVSTITTTPPLSSSGTNNVNLSLGMDNSTIGLNGSNQLTLLDKSVSASKLDQMGAAPGQVLKWTGPMTGWMASDDLNTGLVSESDPHVHAFARTDKSLPPSCAPHQTLFYFVEIESFTCEDIVLSDSQTDQIVAAAVADNISDGVTDFAPSQNAVFDALATKQDTIDSTSNITLKSLNLMTADGVHTVGFKAPLATVPNENILWTLPGYDGDAGQVLKTDGFGNLSWVDPTSGSVTTITANPPLVSSGTNSVTLSLQNGGITNDHINAGAAIAWSKIDKTGATAADLGGVPSTRTLTAGTALSGGGDLSADRTFNVNVDDTTVGVNGSDQLAVKTGGITNDHINDGAAIAWTKINKTGADPSDLGAASALTSILAGTGLTGGGTLSSDRTLNVDVGTTANKIVQLDNSGRLPAVDGSQLTNLGTNLGKWSDATGGIHYSSGNVGIGVTTPNSRLSLMQSTDVNHSGFRITNSANTASFGIYVDASHKTHLGAPTASPDAIVLDNSSGNIGIGTSAPTEKLVIENGGILLNQTTTYVPQLKLIGAVGKTMPSIQFYNPDSTIYPYMKMTSRDGDLLSIEADTTDNTATGTKLMVLKENGNLGIGTSSPDGKLHVTGKTRSKYFFLSGGDVGTTDPAAMYGETSGDSFIMGLADATSIGASNHEVIFMNVDNNNTGPDDGMSFVNYGTSGPSVAMRINGNGNVGIGTTAPQTSLHLKVGNGNFNGALIENNGSTGTSPRLMLVDTSLGSVTTAPSWGVDNSNDLFRIWRQPNISTGGTGFLNINNLGNVGIGTGSPGVKLDVNGGVRGTSAYINSSDSRYKKNIKEITDSLEKVLMLRGVTFDWRTDEFVDKDFKTTRDMGVIAQEVEKVFPEAVVNDDQGYKSVAYSELIAPLINAIKDLYVIIMKQDKRLESLESENKKLQQIHERNQKLESENAIIKTYLCQKDSSAPFCE